VAAAEADAECPGYVGAAPSVVLDYEAEDEPLYLFVRSSADTVLLVRTPGGEWLCNDDDDGVNAGISLDAPEGGRYAVWVGTYSDMGASGTPASLYVSERRPEEPALDASGDPAGGTIALASRGSTPTPTRWTWRPAGRSRR
jgi:serine protease Do/protease YdgD